MTLDGPRLKPAREPATHLVVLCHGYGSDGNDLIGLAPHWRALLPGAAFASPNAPDRCSQSPTGYQWFPLSRLDPSETLKGAEAAAPKLNAILLEPLMKITVTVPEEYLGDVMGDINSKRGKVLGMEGDGTLRSVMAEIPMAEIQQYAAELRSLTSGRGTFEVAFDHYAEVPFNEAQQVIAAARSSED